MQSCRLCYQQAPSTSNSPTSNSTMSSRKPSLPSSTTSMEQFPTSFQDHLALARPRPSSRQLFSSSIANPRALSLISSSVLLQMPQQTHSPVASPYTSTSLNCFVSTATLDHSPKYQSTLCSTAITRPIFLLFPHFHSSCPSESLSQPAAMPTC